ncbi:MAG TPA: hypothetical protein VN938_11070, partial [Xanthobacteraceae bacterium]|nr:hypothetical protein [Xanthobacteraceae bacterium]
RIGFRARDTGSAEEHDGQAEDERALQHRSISTNSMIRRFIPTLLRRNCKPNLESRSSCAIASIDAGCRPRHTLGRKMRKSYFRMPVASPIEI